MSILGFYLLIALMVGAYHAYFKAEYIDTALGKGVLWGWVLGKKLFALCKKYLVK